MTTGGFINMININIYLRCVNCENLLRFIQVKDFVLFFFTNPVQSINNKLNVMDSILQMKNKQPVKYIGGSWVVF